MRYLPLTDSDRAAMLTAIGADSIDELFADIPDSVRLTEPLDLPAHQGEMAVETALTRMAAVNRPAGEGPFFLGAGAYRHHVPATVDHLISRSEFLTSYTPYQPEVSQGTLQYLFEFQTQVAQITGMEVANASMYDGSTACAEAVLMARRVTGREKALIAGGLHPQYADVVETMTRFTADEIHRFAPLSGDHPLLEAIDETTSCVVVQTPDFFGAPHDLRPLAERAHECGALLIAVITEIVSLGAVMSPGEMGADIVVAEGQSVGNALNFGGPYVGLFATRERFLRRMPGRIAGETVDADGKRGFVLTLSTREQHIRREKATSNICTNSGLCALAFTIHMTLLGETGFRRLAALNHQKALALAEALSAVPGLTLETETFFNEFTVSLPMAAADVVDALADKGIIAGLPVSRLLPGKPELENRMIVAATEMTNDEDIAAFAAALEEYLS